jgi:translation initiation factor eIF-2B subunit gamma
MKEFTVILYAGGNNRLSSDLSLPKSLLPVGNRPLIWYTLQIIQSHSSLSSSPLFILTSSQSRQVLDDYLSTLNITYELIIYRQHHESTTSGDDQQQSTDELGTLDILRSCYSRIRTESICLLTCDLFGKVNLTPLINMFRVRDASLTMLLLKTPLTTGKDSLVQPGQKTKFTPG